MSLNIEPTNFEAVSQFLQMRQKDDKSTLLVSIDGEVRIKNRADIDCWPLFLALVFGRGEVALSNVVTTFNKMDVDVFIGHDQIKDEFNAYVQEYNEKQCLCTKISKQVGELSQKIIDIRVNNSSEISEAVACNTDELQERFEEIQLKFIEIKSENVTDDLINEFVGLCNTFSPMVSGLDCENQITKNLLLNQILNFKNNVRAYCLPNKHEKPLKGQEIDHIAALLSKSPKRSLRSSLKNLRRAVLEKAFSETLKKNKNELTAMKAVLAKNPHLNTPFIKLQVKRWGKKLSQGKPILLPKWYHCTKKDSLESILKSEIRYEHAQVSPGAFVANYRETSFGDLGIALTSRIEDTGVNDPIEGAVYPRERADKTEDKHHIAYKDNEEAPYVEGSPIPHIWLGFQRGGFIFEESKKGANQAIIRTGIPLNLLEQIKSENALDYYKCPISYICVNAMGFQWSIEADVREIAKINRTQALTNSEADELTYLITRTFALTFPTIWETKVVAYDCNGKIPDSSKLKIV